MHLPARSSALALAGALLLAPVAVTPAAMAATSARAATALSHAPRGVQAEGGALASAASGAVLWSRGMNTERPMGSITKVMTAIVVIALLAVFREQVVTAVQNAFQSVSGAR